MALDADPAGQVVQSDEPQAGAGGGEYFPAAQISDGAHPTAY